MCCVDNNKMNPFTLNNYLLLFNGQCCIEEEEIATKWWLVFMWHIWMACISTRSVCHGSYTGAIYPL
jgi:hypothetical protein